MEYLLERQPLKNKKIGWLGGFYFNPLFFYSDYTIAHHPATDRVLDWEQIVDIFGFAPDILVYADKSAPPYVKNIESFPCLTVFLSVDTHIHSWYPQYARGFDLLTVSLKDHIPGFYQAGIHPENILWLPAYARMEDQPVEVLKEWDLLFVGNSDPEIFPFRHKFLHDLQEALPSLHVTTGPYRELFPKGKLVLNIAERGDLNYRVFEAMGCGSCLITPEVGHGQSELFTHGEDFFTYPQEDMAALITLVKECLGNDELCKRVAANGFKKVDAFHRASHRALNFLDFIGAKDSNALVERRLSHQKAIHDELKLIYLHFAEVLDEPMLKMQYLSLAKG
ncbi:MAG: glycosyltransferase family protein [Desulfovibrio sp.]